MLVFVMIIPYLQTVNVFITQHHIGRDYCGNPLQFLFFNSSHTARLIKMYVHYIFYVIQLVVLCNLQNKHF